MNVKLKVSNHVSNGQRAVSNVNKREKIFAVKCLDANHGLELSQILVVKMLAILASIFT